MWFKNALVFQYELNETVDFTQALTEERLKPCPPHARFIYGWVPGFTDEMIHETAGAQMICLGKEERILPRGVINKMLEEKIQQIETQQGRTVKRAERQQLAEDLEFELLPKSFCVQKKLPAIIDSVSKQIIINSSSANQASQLTSLLRKTIPAMSIEPLDYPENLSMQFAQWIQAPDTLPEAFELASDCLLFSLDDEKKRINCTGYELPAEEINSLLTQGMATAQISLVWRERIQFTLTHDFCFKKIKSLDYLTDDFEEIKSLDEPYQQQDAALTLLSGELRALTKDVLAALTQKTSLSTPPQNSPATI